VCPGPASVTCRQITVSYNGWSTLEADLWQVGGTDSPYLFLVLDSSELCDFSQATKYTSSLKTSFCGVGMFKLIVKVPVQNSELGAHRRTSGGHRRSLVPWSTAQFQHICWGLERPLHLSHPLARRPQMAQQLDTLLYLQGSKSRIWSPIACFQEKCLQCEKIVILSLTPLKAL
jgi:hypothetical protein